MDHAKHVRVISTSLDPDSRSWRLAVAAHRALRDRDVEAELDDLRDIELPHTGPSEAYEHVDIRRLRADVARATGIVLAAPVYNFQLASSAKNLVELVGREALEGKTVALMCSAGGRGSYMAPMAFANSLMLDFRCWIVPRFVYTVPDDYDADGAIANEDVVRRIDAMIGDLLRRR